jgi:hypothetical protein
VPAGAKTDEKSAVPSSYAVLLPFHRHVLRCTTHATGDRSLKQAKCLLVTLQREPGLSVLRARSMNRADRRTRCKNIPG